MDITKSYLEFNQMVSAHKQEFLEIWRESPKMRPVFDRRFSYFKHRVLERKLNAYINKLTAMIDNVPENSKLLSSWKSSFFEMAKSCCREVFGFTDDMLDLIFSDGYISSTQLFVKQAKAFNKDIQINDIFQAIRNVWIMNSIQILLSMDIESSPSIFAYSMLYPYTDNFIDSTVPSNKDKQEFNIRFRNRLLGDMVTPSTSLEKDIYRLISMIEEQYDRSTYPNVYCSLLGILDSQVSSLVLQDIKKCSSLSEIEDISFQKGSTSVIADGYLVDPYISDETVRFLFGYGSFLQLADDLQDIAEDSSCGHMTYFSYGAEKAPLDVSTNKLFHFMTTALKDSTLDSPNATALMSLMSFSCRYLILGAISANPQYFTKGYMRYMQKYSPVRFKFQRNLKAKLMIKFKNYDFNEVMAKFESIE